MQSSAQLLAPILNATIAGKLEVMDAKIKQRSSLFNNHLELLKGGYSKDSINKALADQNNPDYSALEKLPTEEELNVSRLQKAVADGVTDFSPQTLAKYGVTQSAKDILGWYDKQADNKQNQENATERNRHNVAMEGNSAERTKAYLRHLASSGSGGSSASKATNFDIAATAAQFLGKVGTYKAPEKFNADGDPNPEYDTWPAKDAVFGSQSKNLAQILQLAKQGKDVSAFVAQLPDTSEAKKALAPLIGQQQPVEPPSFDDMYDDLNDPEIPNTAKENLIKQFSTQDIDSLNEVAKRRGHSPLF